MVVFGKATVTPSIDKSGNLIISAKYPFEYCIRKKKTRERAQAHSQPSGRFLFGRGKMGDCQTELPKNIPDQFPTFDLYSVYPQSGH